MKARVKRFFTFDAYINGEYSNAISFIGGVAMTFRQAVALAEKTLRSLSADHAQIFLSAGELAVGDVTKHQGKISVNDYGTTPATDPTTNTTPSTMNEQAKQYFRNVYGTYENLCEQADERLGVLRHELQAYHDNASKGGENRRRNMALLAWDIRRMERKLNTVNA